MIKSSLAISRLLAEVSPFLAGGLGAFESPTSLSRLTVCSSTQDTSPTPSTFKPMFFAVLRGTKVLTIGGNRFQLNEGDCAASSFGLPYVGQVTDATPAAPFVALSLDLDVGMMNNVMLDMPRFEDRWVCSAAAGKLEANVADAFIRLVSLIAAPGDAGILGRSYEYELYYRLLQSEMGDTLRQLGQRNERLRQIKSASDWLQSNPEKPLVVGDLAASVGMSVTSFHRHFKAVTGHSPLAYQRHLRLLEARRILAAGKTNVSTVAFDVGYVSPSQFSREYKSLFGNPPAADLARASS